VRVLILIQYTIKTWNLLLPRHLINFLSIKMSLNRRLELLEWASKQNSYREDHDHKFCNLVSQFLQSLVWSGK
jgi:hypothetical protein